MRLFLGIDGGGTGCRAAVADAEGRVLGRGEAASANIASDPEGARANIVSAARAALDASGTGAGLGDLVATLGLAGANVRAAVERLEGRLPFARTRIETDAAIALRGAHGREDGIAATCGTGSVFAAQRGGAVTTVGGWGLVLGDQGSGARLGRTLLETALLAHDGLVPSTALLAQVVAEADGPDGLVDFAQGASPADFARHAPRVVAAAAEGDAAAERILAEPTAWVAASIDRLAGDDPLPIVFHGGLGAVFAARLAERYAGRVRAAKGSALDGALDMASEMERAGR
jgi:glucosamine kinase